MKKQQNPLSLKARILSNNKKVTLLGFALLFAVVGSYFLLKPKAAVNPVLGFYRGAAGDPSGNKAGSGINQVSNWLNRDVTMGLDFNADAGWSNVEGESWQLGEWGRWVSAKAGRTYVHTTSPFPKSGGSLAECATGAYDTHWQKLGQNLVNNKLQNTSIRFGHEMNGSWYGWTTSGGKEASFAGCFQKFVSTMRATTGSSFTFVWNPNGGGYSSMDLSKAYPGDAFVDYIGVDFYDQSWAANSYPYPSPCDASCRLTRQQNAWNDTVNATGAGLNWFANFARAHSKPLVIPEWGSGSRPDGHGGGDNPYFVQKVHEFITNANNNVAWHLYFDFEAPDGNHRISPVPSTYVPPFPNATAKFKELFSAAPAPVTSGDTSSPSVSVISPTNGSVVTGQIKVQANASDNVGVSKVEFYIDGVLKQTESSAPYCLAGDLNSVCNAWDSTSIADGSHTINVKSYDAAGNASQSSVSVTVKNTVITPPATTDTALPVVTISKPNDGATVAGKVPITVTATDNIEVIWMEVKIGGRVYASGGTDSLSFTWNVNSKNIANGAHTIVVVAKDAAGNVATKTIRVYK